MVESWHSLEIEGVYDAVSSTRDGLTQTEAEKRLESHGLNQLEARRKTTAFMILTAQFKNFLILLLIAAALISGGIGVIEKSIQEVFEAGLILLIIVFIVIVGFYQEYNAERELEALKRMLTPTAVVLRDGSKKRIDAKLLVPGDVILLEAGDMVPTDARIFDPIQLKVNESVLTGEASPVSKKDVVLGENTGVSDRVNIVFMGTTVTNGKTSAVIVETGMKTEFGRIAGSIQDITEERTPLQQRLDTLGKQIGVIVVLICALVFLVGFGVQQTPWLEMLLIAIALAVAAVPEGLPGVVTVALAMGTRRMVAKNVIVRKLPAVETLGSTTVICSDKTGTITHNEMTVKKIYVAGKILEVGGDGYTPLGGFTSSGNSINPAEDSVLKEFLTAASLCNNSSLREEDGIWKATGDPTETSLLVAAEKAGLKAKNLSEEIPRKSEVPFDSERKRMATIHEKNGSHMIYVKGAPDVLLKLCSKVRTVDDDVKITDKERDDILAVNNMLAGEAFRVLAVACRTMSTVPSEKDTDEELVFLGLAAMKDPPREDVKTAIQNCKDAGIRTVMITGDHRITAVAVAREVGLSVEDSQVVTGEELELMSETEFSERVEDISIYARVNPEHKLRIVTALQDKGHVVAMTGDGVNDAPALKKADIGVAMGITGTDVSKEAADMVLTDDNFASIVSAVEEGRGIYDNIKKFFAYLISGNIGEVAIIFITSIWVAVPTALTAMQILIINLVTDGLPALALGVDPFEPNAMKHPPRSRREPLYKGLAPFILYYPVIMVVVAVSLVYWVYDSAEGNVVEAQTVGFLTVAFFEMFQAFASRSTRYSSFKVGIFKNPWLVLAVAGSLGVCLGLVYMPFNIPVVNIPVQDVVHVTPLEPSLFLLIVGLSALGFIYLEAAKTYSSKTEG